MHDNDLDAFDQPSFEPGSDLACVSGFELGSSSACSSGFKPHFEPEFEQLLNNFISKDLASRAFISEFYKTGADPLWYSLNPHSEITSCMLFNPKSKIVLLHIYHASTQDLEHVHKKLHALIGSLGKTTNKQSYNTECKSKHDKANEASTDLTSTQAQKETKLELVCYGTKKQCQELAQKLGFKCFLRTFNYAYLHKEAPAEADLIKTHERTEEIKMLDESYHALVVKHYTHVDDPDYIMERLRSKTCWGIFVDNKPAGFIGEHSEGTMGMLEIFPEYRRQGLALKLEAFKIAELLSQGRIPCDMVVEGNEASEALQAKLGCTKGLEDCSWMLLERF